MADNVQLNPGSGGATLRTLQTAGGLDYPVGVFAYATTLSPGANAVQIVDSTHGMPTSVVGAVEVEQADEAALKATAHLAAGTNLIGKVAAGVDGSVVYNGATPLEPEPVAFDVSTSGDNEIVAAVPGKRICVLQWGLSADGDVKVKWKSGASTSISGTRSLTKYASAGGAPSPWGRFRTAAGEALNLNLSAAIPVGGELSYILV